MLRSTSGAVPLFKSCRNYTTFATFCTLVPVITRCSVQAQSRIFCTIFANESLHSSFLNRWPIMRMETLIVLCNDLPYKISLLGINQATIIITNIPYSQSSAKLPVFQSLGSFKIQVICDIWVIWINQVI